MKSNYGVTMVELVVVIIIIILITTFAVMNGRGTLNQADATEVYAEMNAMKDALNGVILKQNIDSDFSLEQYYDKTFEAASGVSYDDNVLEKEEEWYIIFGKDQAGYESSSVRSRLGLDSINRTYIVNFGTGEVELYQPVTLLNTSVRTYEEVRALVSNS